jgi:hypothetical protein
MERSRPEVREQGERLTIRALRQRAERAGAEGCAELMADVQTFRDTHADDPWVMERQALSPEEFARDVFHAVVESTRRA